MRARGFSEFVFGKEMNQEDIDKINNVFADDNLKGIQQAVNEEHVSYKFVIAIAYEMLTSNNGDWHKIEIDKHYSQKEKDLVIELYEKYKLTPGVL
jgi:hypothetical protein